MPTVGNGGDNMTQIADIDMMRGSLEASAAKHTMEPPAEQQAVQSEQTFK